MEQLENYYDYKYNFVSPKQHKINKSKMNKIKVRKCDIGKTNEELIDEIYEDKVNSIKHVNYSLQDLALKHGETPYGKEITALQEEFLYKCKGVRAINIERKKLDKEDLKKQHKINFAKRTKVIRKDRLNKAGQ